MTGLVIGAWISIIAASPWRRVRPRSPWSRATNRSCCRVPVPDTAQRLRRADLRITPVTAQRVWLLSVAAGAMSGLLVAGRVDVFALALGGLLGGTIPVVAVMARGDRASSLAVESLPEMLELLARSLRGGADLHTALSEVSLGSNEAGHTLRSVLERVSAGQRLGEALDRWVVDLGHRDAAVVRAVIRLGDSTGGSMATAFDRAAATIRERSVLRSEIKALTSQSRTSAMVIALSPIAFLALVAITDPKSSRVLFDTNGGRVSLVSGLVLDGLGMWWMSRLTAEVG